MATKPAMFASTAQAGLIQALGAGPGFCCGRECYEMQFIYPCRRPAHECHYDMSVTTIRLQPEVESGLEAMSEKLHRSKNCLINQAIREFVARQELEQSR